MSRQYQFRVQRHRNVNLLNAHHQQIRHHQYTTNHQPTINHPLHFCLTLLTLSLWAVVWWWLILKVRGKDNFISALDDDYWSYLIEQEQPPAALYKLKVNKIAQAKFDA